MTPISVIVLQGWPGAGKSYSAVRHHICPALEQGRVVCTNIPLAMEKIKERYPSGNVIQFTFDDIKAGGKDWWAKIPAGCLFVLDECWRLWAAGTLAKDIPEWERDFLAMHRHRVSEQGHSTEIVLVCQDAATIAKFCRNLTDKSYRMTKLSALGMDSKFTVHCYQGSVEGASPPKGRLISTFHGKYDAEYTALYASATLSETGLAGTEQVLDKRHIVWKSPSFKYASIAVLLGSAWAIYHLVGVVSSFGKEETPEPPPSIPGISSAVAAPKPAVEAPPVKEVAPPTYSTTWRLSGTYQVGANGRALLQSADGRVKTVLLSECSFDGREFECRLGNELVSRWTGQTKPTDNMVESGIRLAGSSVRAAMK